MTDRIRILHVIKSLGRGGAETLLAETLQLHDKKRFEFHYIYFLPWKDQMVRSLEAAGGVVHCFSAGNNLSILFKLLKVVRYVKDNNIRLVHAHLPWAGLLARLAHLASGVRVIYTEHNKQERYHRVTFTLNKLTFNWQSLAIAVSDDVSDSIIKKINPRIPVRVVMNGVNTASFVRDLEAGQMLREKLGIPLNAPVIGTVAVFRFQKRLTEWLEIAKSIAERNDATYFVIVGDGPLKQQILGRRSALGIESRVIMPGLQTDVLPWLSAMDIYMITSKFEGLPIALLEAMSMECAVISTDAGGIKEVVRHDVDGLVCPVDQPEKLTEFAAQLISNEGRRTQLSASGRARITESFSLTRMVSTLEEIYESELGK